MSTPAQPTQDPVLDQGVLAANQVPGSPNYGTTDGWLIPATITLTAVIYNACKPPAVQALWKLRGQPSAPVPQPTPGETPAQQSQAVAGASPLYTAALALAMQGYTIDVEIDALGYDPVVTMLLRQEMGILWTAPMLTPSPQATPTNPTTNPPAGTNTTGWIKTSVDASDYPPYPVAPAPPAQTNLVGTVVGPIPPGVNPLMPNGGTIFRAGPGALAAVAAGTLLNGSTVTQNGVVYNVSVSYGLMGETVMFYIPNPVPTPVPAPTT